MYKIFNFDIEQVPRRKIYSFFTDPAKKGFSGREIKCITYFIKYVQKMDPWELGAGHH